jgi:predicted dehydrogenase
MAARQINVAVVGLGYMGATHLKAWKQVSGAQVTAVVSSDAKKLGGDLTGVGGNLGGGGGEVMDFSSLRKYQSLQAALGDSEIDAVDICIPTDQHGEAAIAALRAGKHVLLEKPMALDETETEAILSEARSSGRTLMVGHVLRFIPSYAALADALRTSGPARSAFFRRRCGAPRWSRWLTDSSRSGGGIFDLLIHDADFCISCWGMPEWVRASGYEDLGRGIDVVQAELHYPDAGPVIISGGWHHPEAYPFSMEFTVVTDRSTLEWSNGAAELKEYGCDGTAEGHALPDANPFAAELAYFADCVIEARPPERCMPEQSAQAVALMRRIIQSRKAAGEAVPCRI